MGAGGLKTETGNNIRGGLKTETGNSETATIFWGGLKTETGNSTETGNILGGGLKIETANSETGNNILGDFYQIRSLIVCKVTISLVFVFKVTIFIRLRHKLSVT